MNGSASSAVDFISNLPHSLIDIILGCLPLRDIVRTSILSREWRYRWLSCPEIVFNSQFYEMLLEHHELKDVIYQILERHQRQLHKFALQVPKFDTCPDINEWIHMLPNDTLQNLTLEVFVGSFYRLTPHLFTFHNLRYLTLCKCVLDIPPEFEGFGKLVSLDLQYCGLTDETLKKFMGLCPAVERLRVISCSSFDCLEINGPKLKSFDFRGLFDSVSFKTCPVLSDVNISLSSIKYDCGQFSFGLVKSLSSLPSLKDLKLQAYALQGLVEYGAPDKLPMAFGSLRNLLLTEMFYVKTEDILSAICFFKSCPNLQTLKKTAFPFP